MRYENPFYMVEDAGAADLIAGGRLQLGISRGSPEQVIDGFRHFGYVPGRGRGRRRHGAPAAPMSFSSCSSGEGFAEPNPRPMFPNPPGLLRLEPHSPGLRDRIWWGPASNATAVWAATAGHEHAELDPEIRRERRAAPRPAAEQIDAFRTAWREAGHAREPRVSVSRSIFALVDDRDRLYFGRSAGQSTTIGYLDETTRAVFGRTYAAEPDVLVEQLRADTAIAAADTLLLTVPNQLGVDYNAHVIESILTHVAPALGWR